MKMPPVVFFDESGNTGQDLLNRDQPVFVLASAHFEPAKQAELAAIFAGTRTAELKYSALKRSARGQSMMLQFLRHPAVTRDLVKVAVMDKRFMTYAKLVDLIHEPLMHRSGLNLYEHRAALATTNLFWTVYPVCVDQPTLDQFLADFIGAVRERTPARYQSLRASALAVQRQLAAHPVGRDIAASVAPVLIACDRPEEFFGHDNATELDPLVPAYHHLCDAWGKQFRRRFVVEADESKVLAQTRPLLMTFSSPELQEHHQDYYGRGYDYPLKVEAINAVVSDDSIGVQLTDLVAGAHAHFAGRMSQRRQFDTYERAVCDVIVAKGLPILTLWPSTDVTPEAVGGVGPMHSDPVEYAARILADDPATRRSPPPTN